MMGQQAAEGVFRYQRRIAARHEQRARKAGQQRFCLHDGMARSQLLFLYDSFRPVAQIFLHGFAAEADDDDLPLRSRRFNGPQHLFHHRHAADLMQNFRHAGFHPRSFSGS